MCCGTIFTIFKRMKKYMKMNIGFLGVALLLSVLVGNIGVQNAHAVINPNSSLYFSPPTRVVSAGDTFTLDLRINPARSTSSATNHPVALEAHVRFDPLKFRLNSITHSTGAFRMLFPGGKKIDNVTGTSSLVVGLGDDGEGNFDAPVSVDSLVATYNFTSLSGSGVNAVSEVSFNRTAPFITNIVEAGDNLLAASPSAVVVVGTPETVPPTIVLTGLQANSLTVTNESEKIFAPVLNVSLNASDASGISKVELFGRYASTTAIVLLGEKTTAPYTIPFDTRLYPDGTRFALFAVATDGVGNTASTSVENVLVQNSGSTTPPAPPQAPGPALTLIGIPSVTNLTTTSATIVWTTNRSSTSQVWYGKTPIPTLKSAVNPYKSIVHRTVLSALAPNTIYNYRVRSVDAQGKILFSPVFKFKTSQFATPSVMPTPTKTPTATPSITPTPFTTSSPTPTIR